MEKYAVTIQDLSWNELLQNINAVLARDEKALENNVNYYKKLLADDNTDKDRLNRLFEKLQLDKLRYTYLSELFFRLEMSNYKLVIMHLESCLRQETELQNRSPKDWVATIRFANNQLKVYFMALSNN